MPREKADYDSAWKEILEPFFDPCLRFFFPALHAQIDWAQAVVFLDKELQQISYDAETGRHTVDKLVQVHLLDGADLWLLIHLEVQGQWEAAFTTRMYVYNYRLFDRYKRHAVSLAILTDTNRHWRPDCYEHAAFGYRVRLDFPVAKVLDYEPRIAELEQDENPFALVVLSHLRTLQTIGKKKATTRKIFKKHLIHLCWERGYRPQYTGQLLRFLDWVMWLPDNLEQELRQELATEEKELMSQYVTSWERMAKEEGRLEGKWEGKLEGKLEGELLGEQKALRATIVETLELRFGAIPTNLTTWVEGVSELEQLRVLQRQAVTCPSLDTFAERLSLAE